MSAQNDGVSRNSAIPLSNNGTAYIQGKLFKDAGGVQDNGAVAIGNTKPTSALGLKDPASSYAEVLGGFGIDFHAGNNTAGYVDYDVRMSISGVGTAVGNADFTITCGDFNFKTGATGRLLMNDVAGTVGQVLTCDANGVASWQ
jgi:hypothetical protein